MDFDDFSGREAAMFVALKTVHTIVNSMPRDVRVDSALAVLRTVLPIVDPPEDVAPATPTKKAVGK